MFESSAGGKPISGKTSSLPDLGMRLHVPYNNDFSLIEKLIPYAPYIRSVYLPCNHTVLGSGRFEGRAINRNWEDYDVEIKKIAELLGYHGIKVNMLLNSLHVSSDILDNFQGSALYRYLKSYEGSDVEWLTVANIQLAILLRRYFPHFKLDVSVLALIDTVKRARYWYDLVRPDLFCVDLDHGKDLALIRNITALTGVPVKVLVMDFCLPDCPYKPWHYIHNALKEENPFSCWQIRADKPWYYYKGRSIPPYYLKQYAGLIQDIKIVERNSDTDTIMRNIRHYALEGDSRYMLPNGGIILEADRPPAISSTVDKLYFNLNSKHPLFKPVPAKVFERTLSCDLNCGICNFCYDAWKDEWRVREDYDLLAGYVREIFPEAASQRYYLGLLDNLHGQRHNVTFVETIKMMEEYVKEPFKPVLFYFLGLAFLGLKSPLAEVYIQRTEVSTLRGHLLQIQAPLRDQPVICYTDFDQYDNRSFSYVQRLVAEAESDKAAQFGMIESYLMMREEQVVQELINAVDLDKELLERFCLTAFNYSCYDTVIRLTDHLDTVAGLSATLRGRLLVIRHFSKLMKKGATDDVKLTLGTSSRYGQKENFAHLYLNFVLNGKRADKIEQEALAKYAIELQTEKSAMFAKMVYDLYLTFNHGHQAILQKYHQLLLDMNRIEEADEVCSAIDRKYQEQGGELDRMEGIPQKTAFEQYVFVDSPPLVRKNETEMFRVHPVSRRLLELVDTLGGSYKVERSFKFMRNRLLYNRYIVTVPLKESNVPIDHAVLEIIRKLAIPGSLYKYFIKQMAVAKKVHFGFEENGQDSVLKVYLEFPYDESLHMRSADNSEPWLLLLGFKWDPANPSSRYVISRYQGLPSYTPQQVFEKVAAGYAHTQGKIIMPLVADILKMYDNSAPNMPMWYLDVTEEGTPRQSFDIKTYRAQLQIRDLLPLLEKLCRFYNIPSRQSETYFDTIKGHKFGHLSCGTARDGEEFIAIYHAAYGQ